jgi:hypothetical protein
MNSLTLSNIHDWCIWLCEKRNNGLSFSMKCVLVINRGNYTLMEGKRATSCAANPF